jgi:3-oxoacyl-[acyl-carrier-protein] synthase II
VTGIGVLSPVGIGRERYWEALLQGRSGFVEISLFDTAPFAVHIAGEIVGFDPVTFLGKKGLRSLDRSTLLLNSAAKLAIDDSGLEITDRNTHSIGVSVGATFGSLHSISQFDRDGLVEGPRYVNPSHFPNTVINSPASQVSIWWKAKGFNTTLSTGFCASLDAVSYAADFIKFGRTEVVLAGGVEELCEETFLGFHNTGFLSGLDGSEPRSCPFDARRNGVVLAEGAAFLILESEDHAMGRGANIMAEVMGCGNSFDSAGGRELKHSGKGLRNAVTLALKEASTGPDDIDYICSSANSTKGLDRMETEVIKEIFGNRAYNVPVSSIKSIVGESFSASGALSLSAAICTIEKGVIPPTMNYREKDPACDLDFVPNNSREREVRAALVMSSDPFGNNATVVLGRYKGMR